MNGRVAVALPRLGAARISLLVGAVIALAYLRWTPASPDLAAQVARAGLVKRAGSVAWWTGWFGGLSLPSYSVLVPSWMAALGVSLTGALAAVAGGVAMSILARDAQRPRAAAIAFAVASAADLVNGRVTFAVGLAIGAWALVAVRARWVPLAAGLALVTFLASPLAGLFLGLALVTVAVLDTDRRRLAIASAAVLVAAGVLMALLFPGTGTMPFSVLDATPTALCCVGIVAVCANRYVRFAALLMLLVIPVLLVVPGAIGDNITRLVWVCGVPVVIAYARMPRPALIVAVVLVGLWPACDLVGQLSSTRQPSARQEFYQPLAGALDAQRVAAGAGVIGERVEVVDTVNHWASAYLSGVSLARGWDRQADVGNNPIFYTSGALTASSYHDWLHDLAVGWVALPAAKLDYASVEEGALVASGLGYLQQVWSDGNWTLYRVTDAFPLASGATVTGVDASGIALRTAGAGAVFVRARWSSYLTAVSPDTGRDLPVCVQQADGWVTLQVPSAERVLLTSHFDPLARVRDSSAACASAHAAG